MLYARLFVSINKKTAATEAERERARRWQVQAAASAVLPFMWHDLNAVRCPFSQERLFSLSSVTAPAFRKSGKGDAAVHAAPRQ